MTIEQRIAEIREALELGKKWTISATVFTDAKQIDTAITSLDTLAAECLRLREQNESLTRIAYLSYHNTWPHVGITTGEFEELRKLQNDWKLEFDRNSQALDAAKEAK